MRPLRLTILLLALAPLSGEAQAQNIFELLFGGMRRQPPPAQPVPPAPVGAPRGPIYGAPPEGPAPGETPVAGLPPGHPQGPPPSKPVVLKAPSEDTILGRELKLNGTKGSLRIERSARGEYQARLTLAGSKTAQPTEACTAVLGGETPLPVIPQGKPDGVPRYAVQAPSCPIQFDVLDGAVLVKSPVEACVIEAAGCRAEVAGLWGPEPSSLLPRAGEIEQARGAADKAVRENYKALTQRAKPGEVRGIVAEQAAFSSDREEICRSYSREPAHNFCNTRFSEARGLHLMARLGLTATPQQTAEQQPRPRRPRQPVEADYDPYQTPMARGAPQEMVVPR
jgi:hypothetical protein